MKKNIIIKCFLAIGIVLLLSDSFAQPKTKQQVSAPTQKEIEKMLEDAMTAEGMGKEEQAAVRKAMKQATQVADEMKKAGIKGFNINSGIPKIPVKQTGLLQQIPSLQTQQQLNNYFELLFKECKKNIPADMAIKVDQMIIAFNGNENELARQSFLLNGDAYQSYFNSEVQGFYDALNRFSQMQNLYPTPAWINSTCKNYKAGSEKIKLEEIEEQLSCPVNIKLPAGKAASFKINCKTMELEGGELLKLGFERDLKTGEFSLAFGLGMDVNTGFLNAGAKGLMYFKFASDFSPIDMGLKGEAGIEAEMFIFSADEKLTGTMGISSVNIDAVHAGQEINIFNVDATKD